VMAVILNIYDKHNTAKVLVVVPGMRSNHFE